MSAYYKERTYPVAEFVNKNTPTDSVIIMGGEPRAFMFDRKIVLYNIWQKTSDRDIIEYIKELKAAGTVAYLLYRDDAPVGIFYSTITTQKPIYKTPREVDERKFANYLIYKL